MGSAGRGHVADQTPTLALNPAAAGTNRVWHRAGATQGLAWQGWGELWGRASLWAELLRVPTGL